VKGAEPSSSYTGYSLTSGGSTANTQTAASNSVVPQIISVNQYTNQTYVINNISNGASNYSNSYYAWPPASNYNPDSASSYYQAPAQYMQQQTTAAVFNQRSNQLTSSSCIEDTLESPTKEMIKTVYECYQKHLSPMVLLKKDFISNSKSKFNAITNTFEINRLAAIGYNSRCGTYDDGYAASGEIFYKSLHEVAEHFHFYAANLGNFLNEISGKEISSNIYLN
jgi:hypothetical protein